MAEDRKKSLKFRLTKGNIFPTIVDILIKQTIHASSHSKFGEIPSIGYQVMDPNKQIH